MNANDKLRPFLIAKILMERTDEDHTLTTNQIRKILLDEYGLETFRTTVKYDVGILQKVGLGIREVRSKQNRYSYIDPVFSIEELKMLIDTVRTARFMTEEQCSQLESKLTALASPFKQEQVKRNVILKNRYKPEDKQILLTVNVINEAINMHKKIQFQLFRFDNEKNRVLLNEGKDYIVSPCGLVWENDHYHLIGVSTDSAACDYRVDRINSVPTILQEEVETGTGTDLSHYIESMHNIANDPGTVVELLFDNQLIDTVIDKFGKDAQIDPLPSNQFRLTTNVSAEEPLFDWVFSFHGKVKISAPTELREKYNKLVLQAYDDSKPIEEVLGRSRTTKVLQKARIHTMDLLAKFSREELLKIHGIGKVIADNLMTVIDEWNTTEYRTDGGSR